MKILITEHDIANPYVYSLINAYQRAGCQVVTGSLNFHLSNEVPDLLHIQWPESLYRWQDFSVLGPMAKKISARLQWYRERGAIIASTIHNLAPHELLEGSIDKHIYTTIIRESDLLIHHGSASVALLQKHYPEAKGKKNLICHHGDYGLQYQQVPKEVARLKLGLPKDSLIVLCFGNIRPYKGLDLARNIFRKWKNKKKYLLIAGDLKLNGRNIFQRSLFKLKYQVRSRGHNWRIDAGHVSNDKVPLYFSAADVTLVTHKVGLTSGVLALASTLCCPVVYPRLGNFSEQMRYWLGEGYSAGDPQDATTALSRLIEKLETPCRDNSEWLKRNSWAGHVETILSAVEEQKRNLMAGE